MHIKKELFICVFSIYFSSKAQETTHYNSWFRTTLDYAISKNTKIDLEWQHRRQNDVENENLFDKTLMNTIRTWVIYKNNHSWTSYLSPIAFFSHNPIIVNQNQTNAKPLNEIRIATALENEYYVFTNLALLNKIGVEYRFFDGLIQDNVRIRYKCNARFDLSKKTVFILGDELFINLRNTTSQNNFDHNRVFFQTQFKLSTASKIDFGYIFITRSRKTAPFNLQEHNLVLNYTYSLNP